MEKEIVEIEHKERDAEYIGLMLKAVSLYGEKADLVSYSYSATQDIVVMLDGALAVLSDEGKTPDERVNSARASLTNLKQTLECVLEEFDKMS